MLRKIHILIAALLLALSPAVAAEKAMIVFDGSGSMWGQIDGKNKIVIARETLKSVLGTTPEDLELGLIAYGHRQKGQCADIERIVTPAAGQSEAIATAVAGITPKGKTPLSDAVRMAAEELKFTEEKATVILITDGIETCNADPCAVASELEKSGVDFTTHVIGFGLSDKQGKQVACIAENTGGKYLQAKNADDLSEALTETVVAVAPDPKPEPVQETKPELPEKNLSAEAFLDEEGTVFKKGSYRWDFEPEGGGKKVTFYGQKTLRKMPPGNYKVTVTTGRVKLSFDTEVSADKLTTLEPVLNAGVILASVASAPEAEADRQAAVYVRFNDKQQSGYGPQTFVVDAGAVELGGRLGKAAISRTVEIAAGQTLTEKLIASAGVLNASAVYADGGPAVESGRIAFEVFEAKKGLDGSRKSITSSYKSGQYRLPPGDYLLTARLGKASGEAQVTVKAGAATDTVVNINGGVLAITAPGAYSVEIFATKKDLQGNRKSFGSKYGEALQQTLPPGDYTIDAVMGQSGGAVKQSTATITAAERVEIEVK